MKKIAVTDEKACKACFRHYTPSKNDRPNSWRKRAFCSTACSNSRKNKGTFKIGHVGIPNSGCFKKGSIPWNWKGDNVGYYALHSWVIRKLGQPGRCEDCGKNGLKGRQIHWANLSGEYKRELSDWGRLCAKCHKKYDKK